MATLVGALGMQAQDGIRVNYKGAQPSISDFVSALVSSRDNDEEEEECCVDESFNAFCYVWERHLKGTPLEDSETLTIDEKNGYVLFENRLGDEDVLKIEMCYWNEADGKHKLFAYNVACFTNDEYSPGQFDGLTLYRYNNATRTMGMCDDKGISAAYDDAYVMHSLALPRTGKDITVTYWYDSGKKQKTLKWDGHRFAF